MPKPSCAATSAPDGGDVKSFTLTVQLRPPWQLAQPALKNNWRPALMSADDGAPGSHEKGSGELGVRTALRTHSRNAVSAGTLFVLPGNVTVTCGRLAFARAKAFTALGATFRSAPSLMSRP